MSWNPLSIGLPEIIILGIVLILLFEARLSTLFGYKYEPKSLKGIGPALVFLVFLIIMMQLIDILFPTH